MKNAKFVALFLIIFVSVYKLTFAIQIQEEPQNKLTEKKKSYSAFPILMYDSDIGFGYGGKGTIKNIYQKNESLDLILFNSSKGLQWYVFTFSIPDFELRQGELYPLAFDLRLEYDENITSNFFGFGNIANDNEFQFTRKFLKLETTISRAFSKRFIFEFGYRFTSYNVYDYAISWGTISPQTPGVGKSKISLLTARIRWDTRDSQIQPRRGFRAFYSAELSPSTLGGDWNFTKHRMELSKYNTIYGKHIFAIRLWIQHVSGSAPYQELSKIGDGWTARGYKANRFLDKSMALRSLEYRFPIFRKLGGVLFTDAGRVYKKLSDFGFSDWHFNWGYGLRYNLENFVVRMDIGKSEEGSRLFFNFGHVF